MGYSNIEYNGEVHTITDWAKKLGISRMALSKMLRKGKGISDAIAESKTWVRRRNGDWNSVPNNPITPEQITDEAALRVCAGVALYARKDMRAAVRKNKSANLLELRRFFDSDLCALMLACMGVECDGAEAYELMLADVEREIKSGKKRILARLD